MSAIVSCKVWNFLNHHDRLVHLERLNVFLDLEMERGRLLDARLGSPCMLVHW